MSVRFMNKKTRLSIILIFLLHFFVLQQSMIAFFGSNIVQFQAGFSSAEFLDIYSTLKLTESIAASNTETVFSDDLSAPLILIGVIDTGIDASHPKLAQYIYTDEMDLHSIFSHTGERISVSVPTDSGGHGTMVSGQIISMFQAELRPNIRLVSLSIGSGYNYEGIVAAIEFAENSGIRILNLSVNHSYSDESILIKEAIGEYNGLIINSAGNNVNTIYPGKFQLDNMIVVGALNNDCTETASFSNTGSFVDLFAPGENIVMPHSTTVCEMHCPGFPLVYGRHVDYGYHIASGTSFSAPLVSATAALIMLQYPNLSIHQIKQAILNSVDILPSLNNLCISGGQLNTHNAIVIAGQMTYFTTNSLTVNTIEISGVLNPSENIVIPSQINGKTVTAICSNAFLGNNILKEIRIPASVNQIGSSAFANCLSLETAYVSRPSSSGITTSGYSAFYNCPDLTIYAPDISSMRAYKNAANWSAYRSQITVDGLWAGFSDYTVHVFSDYLTVWEQMMFPTAFVISSQCGGYYQMDAHLRTGDGVSVYAYDASSSSMRLIYEFETGYLSETIYLYQNAYYFIELNGDSNITSTFVFELLIS